MSQQSPVLKLTSSDSSVAVSQKGHGIVDLRVIVGTGGGGIPGTVQDGVTDDLPAFNAAIAQLAGAKASWAVFGPMLLNGNPTIPPNVSLSYLPGGMIKTPANKTITYQSIPNALLGQQIFDVSAGGVSVTMPPGLITDCSAEWFGAKGDSTGTFMSTNAFNRAIAFAHSAGDINIRAFPVQYNFDDTLQLCNGSFSHPNLIGFGKKKTVFNYPNLGAGKVLLSMKGGSGQLTGNFVYGIDFVGNATSIAVEFNGQCGSWVENCYFDLNAVGVRWYNERVNDFTEFCTIRGCEFRITCVLPREYKIGAGKNSFHGSGSAVSKCIYNIGAGPYLQIDGPNCFIYNAPIYDQIFATSASATLIQNGNSTAPTAVAFSGELTIETNVSQVITLASGAPVYLTGPPPRAIGLVTGSGANILPGTAVRVETVAVHQDGSTSFTGAKTNSLVPLTTGANTIPSNIRSCCRFVDLILTAANYDYRYILAVDRDSTGGPGFVATVATLRTFNTAGYGPPAPFTVDTSGNLIVTNAGFPASGVSAYVSESQLSSGIQGSGHIQF
jgi:hypothetical protein